MLIAKRLKKGWSEPVLNTSKTNCDECHSRLWEAPSGQPYCNKFHCLHTNTEWRDEKGKSYLNCFDCCEVLKVK